MEHLNTFLGLLSKTDSRDKILRLVQYATLHAEDHVQKGATHNIYVQMRRTRKILRFLRTIQYSTLIRKDITSLPKIVGNPTALVLKLFTILENVCTFLFFYFDHRVFLGELEVISKETAVVYYPKSMKMYMWQNIFGALKTITEMIIIFLEGKYEGEVLDMEKGSKILKGKAIELLRNILDISVARYYLNKPAGSAAKIGIIGVITSLIGLSQSLKLI